MLFRSFIFFGFPSETEREAYETAEFILSNKDIIHSTGHTCFLLTRMSKVMKEPEKYGLTEILPDDSSVLGLWSSYNVERGLTPEQAQSISDGFSENVKDCYSDWRVWSRILREHLLLYVSHYDTRDLTFLLDSKDEICDLSQDEGACLSDNSVVRLKEGLLLGISRFDVARLLDEGQVDGSLLPSNYLVLYDYETGRTLSFTPSSYEIIGRLDGSRTLYTIAIEISEKYDQTFEKVVSDIYMIAEVLIENGLCSWE